MQGTENRQAAVGVAASTRGGLNPRHSRDGRAQAPVGPSTSPCQSLLELLRAFIRLFWVNGAMHYSGPRGRLPSVRAVKPPPPTDKPYCAVRRSIVHTSRRSALALKPSRDCPLSLDHLQTSCLPVSAPHIASACHLEVALTMMRLRVTSAARPPQPRRSLHSNSARRRRRHYRKRGGHQERVLSLRFTCLYAVTRQIR